MSLKNIRFKINLNTRFKINLNLRFKTIVLVTTLRTELRGIFQFYGHTVALTEYY